MSAASARVRCHRGKIDLAFPCVHRVRASRDPPSSSSGWRLLACREIVRVTWRNLSRPSPPACESARGCACDSACDFACDSAGPSIAVVCSSLPSADLMYGRLREGTRVCECARVDVVCGCARMRVQSHGGCPTLPVPLLPLPRLQPPHVCAFVCMCACVPARALVHVRAPVHGYVRQIVYRPPSSPHREKPNTPMSWPRHAFPQQTQPATTARPG